MKSSSTGGLLLLLVAVLGLIGFLTGNLDRWLGYLFDPQRPALSSATTDAGKAAGPVTPVAATKPALVSVGAVTTRQTA